MALDFQFLSLKKDSHNRHYNAEIEFDCRTGKYEIYINAKIYFYDGELSIWDGFDCPFNGEFPDIRIEALDIQYRKYERPLEKAILNFIEKECSD